MLHLYAILDADERARLEAGESVARAVDPGLPAALGLPGAGRSFPLLASGGAAVAPDHHPIDVPWILQDLILVGPAPLEQALWTAWAGGRGAAAAGVGDLRGLSPHQREQAVLRALRAGPTEVRLGRALEVDDLLEQP